MERECTREAVKSGGENFKGSESLVGRRAEWLESTSGKQGEH